MTSAAGYDLGMRSLAAIFAHSSCCQVLHVMVFSSKCRGRGPQFCMQCTIISGRSNILLIAIGYAVALIAYSQLTQIGQPLPLVVHYTDCLPATQPCSLPACLSHFTQPVPASHSSRGHSMPSLTQPASRFCTAHTILIITQPVCYKLSNPGHHTSLTLTAHSPVHCPACLSQLTQAPSSHIRSSCMHTRYQPSLTRRRLYVISHFPSWPHSTTRPSRTMSAAARGLCTARGRARREPNSRAMTTSLSFRVTQGFLSTLLLCTFVQRTA